MDSQKFLHDRIHNLSESINVLDYIITMVEREKYQFNDSDAPHYVAEMKKAVNSVRDIRDALVQSPK